LQSKVYEKCVSASYFSGQRFKVEALRLRRITYDKLQVGNLLWNKPETFLLFDNRWLLLVNGTGIGIMIDIQNDSIVGEAKVSDRGIADIEKAEVFSVNASRVKRGIKELESDFGEATRFPGILRIHGCELVIGNDKVEYLGRVENELIFISQRQLLLINSDQLIESDVTPGCFSIDGMRLEMFEGMSWDYSRFGINVFLNETTLLSLGWEASNYRDEIKGEIWDIGYAGASRRCEIPFLDGIDLPLAVLGVLEDGRIVLTGENYSRSYIIDLQGGDGMLEHTWRVLWSWARPEMPDGWFTGRGSCASDWQWPYQRRQEHVRESTNGFARDSHLPNTVRYWVRIPKQWGKWQHIDEFYKEVPVLSSAEYVDEGEFIDFAGMEIIEDSRDEEFLSLKNYDGELVRWVSDVPIVGAIRVRKHDIVVVKRSGIVTIRQGLE
jgi:hypothetical protein